jgi:hypothetical protein
VGARARTAPGDAEHLQPSNGGPTWIDADSLGRVRGAVARLSERARRLGTGTIELDVLEHRDGQVLVELAGEPPRQGDGRWLGGSPTGMAGLVESSSPGQASMARPGPGRSPGASTADWCAAAR